MNAPTAAASSPSIQTMTAAVNMQCGPSDVVQI
jgi:hypothetical protein